MSVYECKVCEKWIDYGSGAHDCNGLEYKKRALVAERKLEEIRNLTVPYLLKEEIQEILDSE